MDTLISLGTTAAYGWSVVALLALEDAELYFEVASVVTTLILLGAGWRPGHGRSPLAAPSSWAPRRPACSAKVWRSRSRSSRWRSGSLRRSTGREGGNRRSRRRGPLRRRPVDADRRAGPGGRHAGRRGHRRDGERIRPPDRPRDSRRRRHGLAQIASSSPRHRRARLPSSGWPTASRRSSCRSSSASRWRPWRAGSSSTETSRPRSPPPWRPHHRLPLRARAGDADRADGRHGPRCPARHRHQGAEVLEETRRVTTVVLDKTGTVTEGACSSSTSSR